MASRKRKSSLQQIEPRVNRFCSQLILDGAIVTGIRGEPSDLHTVVVPWGVTTIGHHAFYDCESVTSVTLPDSVTAIDRSAFYLYKSVTSVTLPDSVTE